MNQWNLSRTLFLSCLAVFTIQSYALAVPVNVGSISYSTSILDDLPTHAIGTSTLTVTNLTSGGTGVPGLIFEDAILKFTVTDSGSSEVSIDLGNVDPGSSSFDGAASLLLHFPTGSIQTAAFSARISGLSFIDFEFGQTFMALPTLLEVSINLADVILGEDIFILETPLTIEASEVSPVPEPASLLLLASGGLALFLIKRRTS